MALFFDSQWFDARLAAVALTRADVATALGLDATQIADVWKDQRELSANDVRLLSALLSVTPQEIANRAGVSTPVPKDVPPQDVGGFDVRLARVERTLDEIKSLLLELKARTP
jgi:transcriptional regulator with XRE-family HTH domain